MAHLNPFDEKAAASFLINCELHHQCAIPTTHAPTQLAEAYAVQRLVSAKHGDIQAWKVGRSAHFQQGYIAPIHKRQIILSPARYYPFSNLDTVKLEAEIAFRLGKTLYPSNKPISETQARDMVDALVPCLEVLAPRQEEHFETKTPLWKLADQQACAALVVGTALPFNKRLVQEWDGRIDIEYGLSGKTPQQQTAVSHPFNNPWSLLRDALQLIAREYGGSPAGTIITTGSYCGAIEVPRNEAFYAHFSSIGDESLILHCC